MKHGQLESPDGTRIIGTYDTIPGVALILGAIRTDNGDLDPDYVGETEVIWDGQETETDDEGFRLWVDENYKLYRTDELVWKEDAK